MRTTAERLAAAKERARELERERQHRRTRGFLCAGTAACLAVIVSLALAMPGITEGFSDTTLGGGMAASQHFQRTEPWLSRGGAAGLRPRRVRDGAVCPPAGA